MENVNYKTENAYLNNKNRTSFSKEKINKLWSILTKIEDGRFVIPFQRKTEFDDCTATIDYDNCSSEQKAALHNISTLVVHKQINAFDNIFPYDMDVNELVYIVSRGNKNYLVNTEGYMYSRYIVEILNF